jgi:hypothetical protein
MIKDFTVPGETWKTSKEEIREIRLRIQHSVTARRVRQIEKSAPTNCREALFKGFVQRILTGVEIMLNRLVLQILH